MKIFLDTEYTHMGEDAELISIGMVVGQKVNGIYHPREELYLEVPYEKRWCSEFVTLYVLPLLNNYIGCHVNKDNLRSVILNWFNLVSTQGESITICSDSKTDYDFLVEALDNRVPSHINYQFIGESLSYPRMFHYYEVNGLAEHHALHDAKANCYSFKE